MRKIPENYSAAPTFEEDLKRLYEAAGGSKAVTLDKLATLREKSKGVESPAGVKKQVGISSLSTWLRGERVPRKAEHVAFVLQVLIPELERRATLRLPGYAVLKQGTWAARLRAAQDLRKSNQGGDGNRVNNTSPGRLLGGPSPALRNVLPREFIGREEELNELTKFVTGQQDGTDYLSYQAGPWAGKTALLAWFVSRYQTLKGIDFAHHFISGRLGTDRREDFVRVVGEQLAVASGKRRRPQLDPKQPDLEPWYEVAALECRKRGRRLVLIVDGLDEDADAGLDGHGIAGLLPKAPPCGMRVIVSGRPHPRVPTKLVADHPLRDPSIVRWLTESPDARIIRDTALTELEALLDNPGIGQRILGLLIAARGALSGADLGKLVGCTPREVNKILRTVARRSVTPTRADLLPLAVQTHAEAEVGKQTFVLAHAELITAASDDLGEPFLEECVNDLHQWAEKYRHEKWPEATPNYLLTGYTRLVQEQKGKDDGRLAALILDPARQLRIVQRSGTDVALRDLDLIAPPGTAAPSLRHAAEAAICRELLLSHVQPVPGSVPRTVARLGDVRRARALAGASGSAADKALNLADVARVLRAMGDEQAREAAREAGSWARTALEEAVGSGWAASEAEAAAGQAALVLLETALAPDPGNSKESTGPGHLSRGVPAGRDEVYREGLTLLRSARGTSAARSETWAQAARLLTPDHPDDARALLDALEEEAELVAEEDPAEGSAATVVELWKTLASTDPERADRLHDRVIKHASEVWEKAPTLENIAAIASAASLVAPTRATEAKELVATACRWLEAVLDTGTGRLSAADAFHAEFGFRQTLDIFSQAMADTGTPQDVVARVEELGQRVLPEQDMLGQQAEEELGAFAEADCAAEEAFSLADRGLVHEAEQYLQQALALLPMPAPGTGHAPMWLPDLADALIRSDAAEDAIYLLDLAQHPTDRVHVHAAMALAHSDCHQSAAARRHAQEASRAAAHADATGGSWAHAAQALACTGEAESVLDLIARHERPAGAGQRAAWRKADRAVRIATATELAPLAPTVAGELLLPVLKSLHASQHAIQSHGLLSSIAELLPVAPHLPPEQQALLSSVLETAQAQMSRGSTHSWQPEDVLVQAFLHIGEGADPGRQLTWLTQDLNNRGPEHFPTAALALLHAAIGNPETAEHTATLPATPHHRATTLTTLASHLARTPCRPSPLPHPTGANPYTRAIRNLALSTTTTTPPDHQTASNMLHHVMSTPNWHQALPTLTRLTPETITPIPNILKTHLHTPRQTTIN
ncbi:hypothetical protein ACOZE3_29125 [Streptomyces cinereoruber]|uniref:hypothetical protein n=1 Tax=Streptomyces cinereoruber TaxID=67260 RepID=UPI003BF50633